LTPRAESSSMHLQEYLPYSLSRKLRLHCCRVIVSSRYSQETTTQASKRPPTDSTDPFFFTACVHGPEQTFSRLQIAPGMMLPGAPVLDREGGPNGGTPSLARLEAGARQGDGFALCLLALVRQRQGDLQEAARLMHLAAAADSRDAQLLIGRWYLLGMPGMVPKDRDKALTFLDRSARQGDEFAQLLLHREKRRPPAFYEDEDLNNSFRTGFLMDETAVLLARRCVERGDAQRPRLGAAVARRRFVDRRRRRRGSRRGDARLPPSRRQRVGGRAEDACDKTLGWTRRSH